MGLIIRNRRMDFIAIFLRTLQVYYIREFYEC